MEKMHQDITTLYNITHSIQQLKLSTNNTTHLIHLSQPLGFTTLYVRSCHTHHDYIDAATSVILSPHVQPVQDLKKMLKHIEEALPSTMHLPMSSEDTVLFYRYLHIHLLIAGEQFLLLISVPIQDHAQQIEVYEVFNLDIPYENYSACYDIENKYLGIVLDETSAVEISEDQFKTCQKANRQFCILNTPLLPLANPPTCVSALYAIDKDSIQKRCALQIKKASSISIPTSIVWIMYVWIMIMYVQMYG